MAAPVQERREYTQYNALNFQILEARRNDVLSAEYPDPDNPQLFFYTERLLSSLNRQGPNRIYFNEDGILMRVLFFSEKGNPYQGNIEILDLEKSNPRILGTENFSVRKLAHVKQEVRAWRRRFDMKGDLLSNPLFVLQGVDEPTDIVHVGGTSREEGGLVKVDNTVYCRYYESTLGGARLIDLGVGPDYKINDDEKFVPISIPTFMRKHVAPFAIPTP